MENAAIPASREKQNREAIITNRFNKTIRKTDLNFIEHQRVINARIGVGQSHDAYNPKENKNNEKAGPKESVCHHP
jgi:hypothetical protein